MAGHHNVCLVNVNVVDDGTVRPLAVRIEAKGSTANLHSTGLHITSLHSTGLREPIKEIVVHLLRSLRQWLRILNLLLNHAAIRDDGSELRVSTSTFLHLRINRLMKGERWPSITGGG